MHVPYGYSETLAVSERINWRVEDIIGGDHRLDLERRFLPEALAGVEELDFLNESEKRTLNQIRGHAYLATFALVEEFILPFVLGHARSRLDADDYEVRALLQFATEEAKHIHLFKRFMDDFARAFGCSPNVIGPASAVAEEVLAHGQLGVAIAILHIEWMTQRHYVESAKDDGSIDRQFESLLRHHWMEEAQHAKYDTLIVEAIATRSGPTDIEQGLRDYDRIGRILASGLSRQVHLDLESFCEATGRELDADEKKRFIQQQERSAHRTFLEAGASHPNFVRTRSALERM